MSRIITTVFFFMLLFLASCGTEAPVVNPIVPENPGLKTLACESYIFSYNPTAADNDRTTEILNILGGLNSGFHSARFTAFPNGDILFSAEKDSNQQPSIDKSLDALSKIEGVKASCDDIGSNL